MSDNIVPVAFLLFLGVIIVAPKWLRSRERQKLMETLKLAYERGQAVPPELIESVLNQGDGEQSGQAVDPASRAARKLAPNRDLRRGAVLVAVALAILAVAVALGVDGDNGALPLAGVAAFPGFLGLTFIALWRVERRA